MNMDEFEKALNECCDDKQARAAVLALHAAALAERDEAWDSKADVMIERDAALARAEEAEKRAGSPAFGPVGPPRPAEPPVGMLPVSDTLRFFRSVIKSGEPWSEYCEQAFNNAVAALASRPTSEPLAWMIERGSEQGQAPIVWLMATGNKYEWTPYPNRAKHFHTKHSAEAWAEEKGVRNFAVTEHLWIEKKS